MAKQNGTTRSPKQSRPSGAAPRETAGDESSQRRATASAASRGGGRKRAQAGSTPARKKQPPRAQGRSSPRKRPSAIAGAGTAVVDSVKSNPIPAALIGAGLTWLLVQNRARLSMPQMPQMPQMPNALTGIADSVRDSFNDTAQSTRQAVRDGVGTAADSVRDGAATLAEYAQSGAEKVSRAARKGMRRGREAIATTWDEHPLTVGLTLLAAGVAAGMLLPTPKGAVIAQAAKDLTRSVTSTGEDLLDKGREIVNSSARAVSREAKRQGLTPTEIGRKVRRVATAVTS